MVITLTRTAKATRKKVMINNRSLVLNPSVVKNCNNHKGPISIPSPLANVMQVTNLFILDSLLYIVVVLSKFFNGFLYRVSLRYDILGCSSSSNTGVKRALTFLSLKRLSRCMTLYRSTNLRIGVLGFPTTAIRSSFSLMNLVSSLSMAPLLPSSQLFTLFTWNSDAFG